MTHVNLNNGVINLNKFPAPWTLNGYGYILLYRFDKTFVNKQAPDFLVNKAMPGFGSVMLVKYNDSNCGPYDELLIIPGKYKYQNKKLNTISKIYVSSQVSVENGRLNWGIPKEHAHFQFEQISNRIEKVVIKDSSSELIFEAKFKSGLVPFPVNTALLPFPLIQRYNNLEYLTQFKGKGIGRLAKMIDLKVNSELFPGIDYKKPLIIIKVSPFKITFPTAIISNIK